MQQSIDWNLPIFALMALQFVGTLIIGANAWFERRRRVTKDEIAKVAKDASDRAAKIEMRVDDHAQRLTRGETRFQRIEDNIGDLPTANTVSDLRIAMTTLTGELKVTNQRLVGVEDIQEIIKEQVGRIDTFLRNTK